MDLYNDIYMGLARYKNYIQGGDYHIYNRGVGGQAIFADDQDKMVYIKRLRKYRDQFNIGLLCYCLMPNHVHLSVRQNTEVPAYKFMQSLHTSYGMYFNKKYHRVGSLWQDRFKQNNIYRPEDLLYLSFYVHLNPLADGLVDKLEGYKWSSYLDFIGYRGGTLCAKELILAELTGEQYKQALYEVKDEIVARKDFRRELKDKNINTNTRTVL